MFGVQEELLVEFGEHFISAILWFVTEFSKNLNFFEI